MLMCSLASHYSEKLLNELSILVCMASMKRIFSSVFHSFVGVNGLMQGTT